VWYNTCAFAATEDRATLGSDSSADADFKEWGYPRTEAANRPLENQSDKPIPLTFLENPVVHFIFILRQRLLTGLRRV